MNSLDSLIQNARKLLESLNGMLPEEAKSVTTSWPDNLTTVDDAMKSQMSTRVTLIVGLDSGADGGSVVLIGISSR